MRTGAGRSGAGSIGGFLRKTQRTLLDTPWQIIQVMETGQPGEFEFRAFYLISVYCGDFDAKGDGTDFLSRVILDYSGIFTNKMIGLRAHIT